MNRKRLFTCFASTVLVVASTTSGSAAAVDGAAREESRMVALGSVHSCAITPAGGVKCWGSNDVGQLGDGTNIDRLTATDVQDLASGVVEIAAGSQHTCGLTSAGGVLCWGQNGFGALGDGTNVDRNIPTSVAGLGSGVISITAGADHTCAVTDGGGTYCWGKNDKGQLGDGTLRSRNTPTPVVGLAGAVAVQAGSMHTCARDSVGALYCWGSNHYGQLGDGTNTDRKRPTSVVGLSSGVLVIAGGGFHTCAITSTSNAFCWGANWSGQIGDGTQTHRNTPTPVSNTPSTIATVSGGGFHTCGLYSGQAACWGSNSRGQLGTGGGSQLVPTKVQFLDPDPIAISGGGGQHTCALTLDGEAAQCWGEGIHGELGNGELSNRSFPVDVVGFP